MRDFTLGFLTRTFAYPRLFRQRHRLEQQHLSAAAVQERRFRLMFEALPLLAAGVDPDERLHLVHACPAVLRPREAQPLQAFVGPAAYRLVKPCLEKARGGAQARVECAIEQQGQGPRTFAVAFLPELDAASRVVGVLMLAHDVTEDRDREAELQRAKAAAEASSRAKTAFLANMSHEIRTPLGAVLGYCDLLLSGDLPHDDTQAYFAAIKRNGALLSSLINNVLDLSKIEVHKLEVELQPIGLADVLADIETSLGLTALEKGIELHLHRDGPLPRVVDTDPLRLSQILLNVIGNAIKFTDSGRVDVRVSHSQRCGEPCLTIGVCDTGPGLSASQAAKLFQPFTQADSSINRKFGGTGLGLALAKGLAQKLGGDVVLSRSEVGVGSTFTITVHSGGSALASLPGDDRHHSRPVLSAPALPQICLAGLSVLLVEDTYDNQILVGQILRRAGATVDTASDGREALGKVSEQAYDVVLMDLQMPVMDGFTATAELRRRGFRQPIVALTAYALKDERQRCLASGFNEHISKPIDRHLLLERLAALIH